MSRFDRLVLVVLMGLSLTIVALVWRGDRVGVRVVELVPAGNATEVSTRPVIRITFDQPMQNEVPPSLAISPAIPGTIRWEGNSLLFVPAQALQPDSDYQVVVPAGLPSQQGQQLLRPVEWSFRTGRARLIYLAPDQFGLNQLFTITPGQTNPTQLSDEPFDVVDYAAAPNGTRLAYSLNNDSGNSDIWVMSTDGSNRQPLILCAPEATCNAPVWSPDSQKLVYERRNLFGPAIPPGPPRLWWYDWQSGETVPIFQDSQFIGLSATFSANGQWLAYIAPITSEIHAYQLSTGRTVILTSHLGEAGVWNPAGDGLLITEVQFIGQSSSVHIYAVDLESGGLTDLSGPNGGSDQLPTWSPDGQTIAFVRQTRSVTLAGQLWLMQADGTNPIQLTNEPDIHHGQPAWSPDGRYLAFRRYNLKEVGATPALWLFDIESGAFQEVARPANRPGWLP